MGETSFTPPEFQTDLFQLPSGDWINIALVNAGRISERANRQTGEIGANVFINADGSWYTVCFESKDDAGAFLDALMKHRNEIHRPREASKPLGRREAADFIAGLRNKHDQDDDNG